MKNWGACVDIKDPEIHCSKESCLTLLCQHGSNSFENKTSFKKITSTSHYSMVYRLKSACWGQYLGWFSKPFYHPSIQRGWEQTLYFSDLLAAQVLYFYYILPIRYIHVRWGRHFHFLPSPNGYTVLDDL